MTTTSQPALAFEQADVSVGLQKTRPESRRPRTERVNWSATIILILCSVTVLLPLYVTISMAFKTTGQAVDGNAFSLPAPFSIDGFVQAWNLTKFPVGAAISATRSSTCSPRCSSRSPSSRFRRSSSPDGWDWTTRSESSSSPPCSS
jgi:hypothetical protein